MIAFPKKITVAALMGVTALATAPAFASNATVENTLRGQKDVSSFYEGLVNTGVLDELDEDTSYTIFAPTNKAMAKISPQQYPCFYSQQCKEEVAEILRNHIVSNPLQLGSGPDVSSAYSVNMEQLNISSASASRNGMNTNPTNFMIDGRRVVKAQAMGAGHLYQINGVIASPQQKMNVSQMKYAPVDSDVVLMQVPATTRVVNKKVFYAPDGQPDGLSQTTVTTEITR